MSFFQESSDLNFVRMTLAGKLIKKYDVPGPRYTSYPTVPFWKNDPMPEAGWIESLETNKVFFGTSGTSLYVHLPYCESLCTFCGCHKRITRNHAVEEPYMDAVLKEWELYREKLSAAPEIRELHLGGGTPTFFAPSELKRLITGLFGGIPDPEKAELGFEGHPASTSEAHLETLYTLGFRRLSLGIQDYNTEVQRAIHRFQTEEEVTKVHEYARKTGYTSISHDLVFGLPKQTKDHMRYTIQKTLELLPDRISLYSYAHVPWIPGNGQRGFDETDIPSGEVKRELYEIARERLLKAGYVEIGMDHFALPHDALAIAFETGRLHRNFMGYTTMHTGQLIGLGMSAISDSWFAFAQNEKTVERYIARVQKGELPIFRGHLLSDEDLEVRCHILDLMCHFSTELETFSPFRAAHEEIFRKLDPMVRDGLVEIEDHKIRVTESGIPFVRNCCMAFDRDLHRAEGTRLFSRTV